MLDTFKKLLLFRPIQGVEKPLFYITAVGWWLLIIAVFINLFF